ncbi:MAG: SoxR reducing system RseC family protein [candidate division WOR-3 bacterium]
MEESGTVVKVLGERAESKTASSLAEVEVAARGECAHCPAHGMCNWTGQRTRTVLAINTAGARVGDTVVISFKPAVRLRSSLVVFGIPALGMLAGVVLGSLVVRREAWAGVLAGAGLVLGFGIVRLLDLLASRSGRVLPVVVGIQNAKEPPQYQSVVNETIITRD